MELYMELLKVLSSGLSQVNRISLIVRIVVSMPWGFGFRIVRDILQAVILVICQVKLNINPERML
ncbi:MAG: hypothetical protein Q4A54_11340 [Parabacteroides sp.]|nr:hypothetical protein [Parabacteroides sp.]